MLIWVVFVCPHFSIGKKTSLWLLSDLFVLGIMNSLLGVSVFPF